MRESIYLRSEDTRLYHEHLRKCRLWNIPKVGSCKRKIIQIQQPSSRKIIKIIIWNKSMFTIWLKKAVFVFSNNSSIQSLTSNDTNQRVKTFRVIFTGIGKGHFIFYRYYILLYCPIQPYINRRCEYNITDCQSRSANHYNSSTYIQYKTPKYQNIT